LCLDGRREYRFFVWYRSRLVFVRVLLRVLSIPCTPSSSFAGPGRSLTSHVYLINILVLVILSTRRVHIVRLSAARALAPYGPAELRPGRTRQRVPQQHRSAYPDYEQPGPPRYQPTMLSAAQRGPPIFLPRRNRSAFELVAPCDSLGSTYSGR
jgi:hypothetical protein